MTEELSKWNTFDKVVAVVTDDGANIKAAVMLMKLSHVPFTALKLNLIIQQYCCLIMKRLDALLIQIKKSEVANRMLMDKQKQLGNETVLKLKQDIRTRWNSRFFVMEMITKLKEPIIYIVMITLKNTPCHLNSDEWNKIEDIVPLLRPFDGVTVELSAKQYPKILTVISLIRGLQISLGSKNPTMLLGNCIKQRLIEDTAKRFESIEKQGLTSNFSRATLLDRRCKKNKLHKKWIKMKKSIMCGIFCNLESRTSTTSSATSLMNQYINMPHQDFKSNVAMFWNEHKVVLTPLSDIVLKY
ncbi:zinc finger BED domain-containing protein 1-like [Acyrthosiphon pisum]|uniref:Uncharacterized protein n=1 Tax=Acyrthosiphon pisum TaxID=7029 RepID=A0A8R2FD88_ACYPI|nr:zinc finger BED domain-containing protein 1-like [Acyrthosiphon pisum]|eukprot:XP_008189600.1 PREDICTED: zinc finger BED domain-containing protein 1-like [Acyrthosiphon pisum]